MLHSFHAPSRPCIFFSPIRKKIPATFSLPSLRSLSPVVCCAAASSRGPLEFDTLECRLESEDLIEGRSSIVEESGGGEEDKADVEEEKQDISGIYVPRQKYIPISKDDLLDGVLSMFASEKDGEDFRRFAKCLDLILHSEHKGILEAMRTYHSLMHAEEKEIIGSLHRTKPLLNNEEAFAKDIKTKRANGNIENFYNDFNLRSLFGSSSESSRSKSEKASSVIPAEFQHMFMKLLRNAQFEELSAQDLLLTDALNTDYLLTLPIYVDWKKASESNAIIFRRGYATEREKGFLVIEKLDYLQSRLLQKILFGISRPLKRLGFWINEEPAFQELILLYTEETALNDSEKSESRHLQLKIYERIPYPELPVVFPHKKLSFRILDTVRLDVASILGLSAYFVNYKFEDILSSPSAFLLDVVAISALLLSISRVGLGYKQTWDRYQLLVNRTLYEKTLASGFGSVHFLLDASEQQQYKEAILAYAVLLCTENLKGTCRKSLADSCEIFLFNKFHEKVEMPIENAIKTLLRLGIVKETRINGSVGIIALPSLKAYEALKGHWDDLIS